MWMILEWYGSSWGIPHRTPHAGPHMSLESAHTEIALYFERWPEDVSVRFGVFRLTEEK